MKAPGTRTGVGRQHESQELDNPHRCGRRHESQEWPLEFALFRFLREKRTSLKRGGTAALRITQEAISTLGRLESPECITMITQEAKSRPARITGMHYNDHTRGHMRHTRPSASESRGVLQHQTLSTNQPTTDPCAAEIESARCIEPCAKNDPCAAEIEPARCNPMLHDTFA